MRTVVLTLDNLGAAAEEERAATEGRPAGEPASGEAHASVDVALPWLLDLLGGLSLRATFFVEGVSARRHPDAVASIAAAGHEVGLHAWHHDRWGALDDGRQAELLDRGLQAFGRLGLRPRSFRPPGGELTPASLGLLAQAGFRCCSPQAGDDASVSRDPASGVVVVPFRWELVDALYAHAPLAARRLAMGLGEEPLALGEGLAETLLTQLTRDDPATLVLHPFLMASAPGRETYGSLLRGLARDRDAGELEIARCEDVCSAFGDSALYG